MIRLFFRLIFLIAVFGFGVWTGYIYLGKNSFDLKNCLKNYFDLKSLSKIQEMVSINPAEVRTSLMVDFGNGQVKTYQDIKLGEDRTVLGLLKKAGQENNFELKFNPSQKGMGVFITAIDGKANDAKNNKWWQYWVNNKFAQKAADQLELKNGDVVEWKLVKPQY